MKRSEAGVALVLAIFTLMLISVIATSLILMAGTATAIKTNYKTSMHAFYDAKAGLEEGRNRVSPTNPNNVNACMFPVAGEPMPLNQVCYIVNPASGETVDPTDTSSGYGDAEWTSEFPSQTQNVPTPVNSNSPVASAGIGGPLYKWVRVTPATEWSLGVDVNGDASINSNDRLFLGPDGHQFPFSGVGYPSDGSTQVFGITALAVTPSSGYSGRRLLQYTVAQKPLLKGLLPNATLAQAFPAALTMVGPNPDNNWYEPAFSRYFHMNGNDRYSPTNAGSCSLAPQAMLPAFGVTGDPSSIQADIASISSGRRIGNYAGFGGSSSTPSVVDISNNLFNTEQTKEGLEALVSSLASVATEVVNGPNPATTLPDYGTPANPVIAVVRGTPTCPDCPADFTLGGSNVGYGILLVTGTLTVRDTAGWRGLVLVIGKGVVNGDLAASGSEIDGAMLVAATRDATTGALLPDLSAPLVDWSGGRGGFYYDSCWMANVAAAFPFQVLSFREIQQQ
jgi:hypothetical protein